jgi:hypothetical protein
VGEIYDFYMTGQQLQVCSVKWSIKWIGCETSCGLFEDYPGNDENKIKKKKIRLTSLSASTWTQNIPNMKFRCFTPVSKTTCTHSVKGCMGSMASVGVSEKRQTSCPSGNELQLADRGLVATDNASYSQTRPVPPPPPPPRKSDKNAENRAKFCMSLNALLISLNQLSRNTYMLNRITQKSPIRNFTPKLWPVRIQFHWQ